MWIEDEEAGVGGLAAWARRVALGWIARARRVSRGGGQAQPVRIWGNKNKIFLPHKSGLLQL